jgi:outer membrane protein
MKNHRLTIALLSILGVLSLPPVHGETLIQAWNAALQNDYRLKSTRESLVSAHETVKAAKALRYPSLKAQAEYYWIDPILSVPVEIPLLPTVDVPFLTDDRFYATHVSLTLPLFTSGRITNAVKSARSAEDATRWGTAKTVQDIKLDVGEAYVTVLRAENALNVARSNVNALSAHARDVTNFYTKGLVPKNDQLAVAVALADARQNELQAENAVDLSRAAYNRLLGRPLSDEVHIEDIAGPGGRASSWPGMIDTDHNKDCESLIREALENRDEIKALADQSQAYAYHAKSIRGGTLPQVVISGSYHYIDDDIPLVEQDIWIGTVGVQWNLFDGGVTRHQALSEKSKSLSAEHLKKNAESLIALEVRKAWLDYRETRKRIAVTQDALTQSKENLSIAKNRYAREIGNNTEVLDAETLRIASFTNHNNAVYDSVIAGLRLSRALGRL